MHEYNIHRWAWSTTTAKESTWTPAFKPRIRRFTRRATARLPSNSPTPRTGRWVAVGLG